MVPGSAAKNAVISSSRTAAVVDGRRHPRCILTLHMLIMIILQVIPSSCGCQHSRPSRRAAASSSHATTAADQRADARDQRRDDDAGLARAVARPRACTPRGRSRSAPRRRRRRAAADLVGPGRAGHPGLRGARDDQRRHHRVGEPDADAQQQHHQQHVEHVACSSAKHPNDDATTAEPSVSTARKPIRRASARASRGQQQAGQRHRQHHQPGRRTRVAQADPGRDRRLRDQDHDRRRRRRCRRRAGTPRGSRPARRRAGEPEVDQRGRSPAARAAPRPRAARRRATPSTTTGVESQPQTLPRAIASSEAARPTAEQHGARAGRRSTTPTSAEETGTRRHTHQAAPPETSGARAGRRAGSRRRAGRARWPGCRGRRPTATLVESTPRVRASTAPDELLAGDADGERHHRVAEPLQRRAVISEPKVGTSATRLPSATVSSAPTRRLRRSRPSASRESTGVQTAPTIRVAISPHWASAIGTPRVTETS